MHTTDRPLALEAGPIRLALETGEVAAPPEDASRSGGRRLGPHLASAVSHMALGALLTMLVLTAIGTFDRPQVVQTAAAGAPVRDTPIPVTAADLRSAPATDGDTAAADAPGGPDAARQDRPLAQQAPPVARGGDRAAVADPVQRADPAFVEIPAIGVSASVIPLGTDGTGALEVPQDFTQTGWWTGGAEPGELGPAVVVGHVDSYQGPAVFFDLDQLAYDDLIRITRTDGSAATFAVRSSVAVDKDSFPTDLVYGPTSGSELRLITCDGDFADGSYLGNLIVTAELLAEDPAPATGTVS